MIYKRHKYKDIYDFVALNPKSKVEQEYTILFKCNGLDEVSKGIYSFNNKCFGCLFCLINNNDLTESFYKHFSYKVLDEKINALFKGNIITPLNAHTALKNQYKNLEYFTKVAETENIQPWAAGILNSTCSKVCRIGMEINVPNEEYDRDGRLDICAITDNYLLVIESKVSLEEALKDERFIEQNYKYLSEIAKASSTRTLDYDLIILIGGKETDLLPPDHPQCSSIIGAQSLRFYKILDDYGIRFISANALWGLALKYLRHGNKYAWDIIIPNIFKDDSCVGFTTAGKIVKSKAGLSILEID